MQAQQMAECLQNLSPLLDGAGAEVLLRTADGLSREGAKSFGPVATKLVKRLTEAGLVPSKSASSDLLFRLADVGRVGGAGTLSKDFFAAARIVEFLGSVDAAQIPTTLAVALAPPPKRPPPQRAARVVVDPREAADKLTAAVLDGARFDELVKELGKLSKDKLAEVAEHFLGYPRQYKSKPEIIKALRSRQLQDALDASREERGSKISV
jgi:hypothetical protein